MLAVLEGLLQQALQIVVAGCGGLVTTRFKTGITDVCVCGRQECLVDTLVGGKPAAPCETLLRPAVSEVLPVVCRFVDLLHSLCAGAVVCQTVGLESRLSIV